jgi:putative membrane protein
MTMNSNGSDALTPNSPIYRWVGPAAQAWLPGLGIALLLAAIAAAYAMALYRSREPVHRPQALRFFAGIGLAIFILSGPVERLALERMYSAYILQQVVLVMIVAPLILSGLPGWMVRRALTNRFIAPGWRLLVNPVCAMLLFGGIFAMIHYPSLCDEICHARPFYYSIRLLLIGLGILLWWPVLSPLEEFPRLSYPMQILYLFLLMIPMTAIAAPITMSRSVLYVFYEMGPHPFGFTPIQDQVMGGLIMWVGQGLYVIGAATWIFMLWSARESGEDHEPSAAHERSTVYQAGKS